MKVAKRADLQVLIVRQNVQPRTETDVKYAYGGHHFAIQANIKELLFTPETTVTCQLYLIFKKIHKLT